MKLFNLTGLGAVSTMRMEARGWKLLDTVRIDAFLITKNSGLPYIRERNATIGDD
jgi:hypothetical protein